MFLRTRIYTVSLLALCTVSMGWNGVALARAQSRQNQSRPGCPQSNASRPENPFDTLLSLTKELAERHQARILVDPALTVPSRLALPGGEKSLKSALDSLVRALPGSAWRTVRLASDRPLPTAARLAAVLRTLDRITRAPLAIENPATRQATLLLNAADTETVREEPQAGKPPTQAVTILYSLTTTDDGRTQAERFADLQRQQLELMERLPPEQKANPMEQTMAFLRRLDPKAQEQFAGRMKEVGDQVWENTPREQRQAMLQGSMQLVQGLLRSRQEQKTDRPAVVDYRQELEQIVLRLSRRYRTTILVEPDFFLDTRPVMPEPGQSLDKALETLLTPLHGVTWRRIYGAETTEGKPPAPKLLAREARALEALEPHTLEIEANREARAWRFMGDYPLSGSLVTTGRGGAFSHPPLLLLYATLPPEESQNSPARHYADIQRQQLEMLLAMETEQLLPLMERSILLYQNGDAAQRSRVLGLPIMAGVMATWFPRAAQEQKAPKP